jgi:tRNA-specific 2-thiouridylase
VVGTHEGFARYTIGQRKGIPGGMGEPRYVVAIRPGTREVVIGTEPELDGFAATLETFNWLADPLAPGADCFIRVRHRGTLAPARIETIDGDTVAVTMSEAVRAISPGQSGVLYAEDGQVLGGGVLA